MTVTVQIFQFRPFKIKWHSISLRIVWHFLRLLVQYLPPITRASTAKQAAARPKLDFQNGFVPMPTLLHIYIVIYKYAYICVYTLYKKNFVNLSS